MIYKGQFRDLNNNLYTVQITTEGDTTIKEITLGGSPFTTEMDSDGKTIYKPAKYQGATVNIITPDYNFDIYSAKAQGTKVELLKEDDSIAWTGYVEPNLYNMGFERYREEVEIECIDALSSLQYIKYDNRNIVSFIALLRYLLQKCNAYTYLYISDSLQLTKTDTSAIYDKLLISGSNFFDKKDDDEEDKDVAWTCQDILEEVCQYLGLTIVAYETNIYMLDYDAIKSGSNTYFKYNINTTDAPTTETLSFSKTITGDDYSENGSTLSLDNVYNKVTVKDALYTFDNVIPDIFDAAENITASTDATLSSSTNVNNGMYGEVTTSVIDNGTSKENDNMITLLDRTYNPQKSKYGDYNVVFAKYFKNPYYKFYKYKWDGSKLVDATDTITTYNYTDSHTYNGATIAKFDVEKLDKTYNSMELYIDQILNKTITLDDWLAKNEFSSVSFTDCIVMINNNEHHIDNADIEKYPYFQTTVSYNNALYGGKNAYLIISGTYNFHYFTKDPYPIPESESDISEGRYAMDAGESYLLCKLQLGSNYWDGSKWTTTASTFKLPFIKEDASASDRRADATMFKDNKFINTVNWRVGTKETGYCIPISGNNVISGLPLLTVYKPFDPNYHSTKSGDNEGQHYKMNCVFLKNFKIKAVIGNPAFNDSNESDTVYTNVISDDYVKELKEIQFKICTWDNKKPNYSAVAYTDGTNIKFLDKTYNKVLATGQTNWAGSDSDGFRQEEHMIYRLWNQYSTPSIKLELSLKNDNLIYGLYKDTTIQNKDFIIDSVDIDYKMNKQKITLIEKK